MNSVKADRSFQHSEHFTNFICEKSFFVYTLNHIQSTAKPLGCIYYTSTANTIEMISLSFENWQYSFVNLFLLSVQNGE